MIQLSDFRKTLITIAIMLAGLFFIVTGIIGLRNADSFIPTKGTIKSIEKTYEAQKSDETDTYEVMVEYTVDGKTYVSDLGVMKDEYSVGKQIDILYNPEDPNGITLPGKTGSYISIVAGAIAFLAPILLFLRKKEKKERFENVALSYEGSVQGDERELYFISDMGTAKVGHRLEDKERNVLYEAKVTRFTMLAPTVMEFIDHVSGESSTHQVGHQVETSYNSLLIDNHYTFTLDGEDIWDHLKRAGITVKSGFMDGKPLWVQYRISRDGEEIARVESSSIHVHEEDLEGKGKLANLIPARGFYRIWTKEQNVDLLFVTMMAFARTGANDENGGNFGLLFNK